MKSLFAGCIVASLPGSGCLGQTVRVRKRRRRRREDEEEVLNPANPAALNLCLSAPEEERELEHCEPVTATRAPPAASASLHYFFFSFLISLALRFKKRKQVAINRFISEDVTFSSDLNPDRGGLKCRTARRWAPQGTHRRTPTSWSPSSRWGDKGTFHNPLWTSVLVLGGLSGVIIARVAPGQLCHLVFIFHFLSAEILFLFS